MRDSLGKNSTSASHSPNGSSLVTRMSGRAAMTVPCNLRYRASSVDRASTFKPFDKGSFPGHHYIARDPRASDKAYRRTRSQRLCTTLQHCGPYRYDTGRADGCRWRSARAARLRPELSAISGRKPERSAARHSVAGDLGLARTGLFAKLTAIFFSGWWYTNTG
jgi:hypothetical protein